MMSAPIWLENDPQTVPQTLSHQRCVQCVSLDLLGLHRIDLHRFFPVHQPLVQGGEAEDWGRERELGQVGKGGRGGAVGSMLKVEDVHALAQGVRQENEARAVVHLERNSRNYVYLFYLYSYRGFWP
jgi:hypothetical protein